MTQLLSHTLTIHPQPLIVYFFPHHAHRELITQPRTRSRLSLIPSPSYPHPSAPTHPHQTYNTRGLSTSHPLQLLMGHDVKHTRRRCKSSSINSYRMTATTGHAHSLGYLHGAPSDVSATPTPSSSSHPSPSTTPKGCLIIYPRLQKAVL